MIVDVEPDGHIPGNHEEDGFRFLEQLPPALLRDDNGRSLVAAG